MIEQRLLQLGLELPPPPAPAGAYVPAVRVGPLVFVSGQLPLKDGQLLCRGVVGRDVDVAAAQQAARQCALNGLACVRGLLGDLARVRRVVRVNGYVASTPDFHAQPLVINGASELLQAVLPDSGGHTRVAVGVAALPLGAAVEVDLIVELGDSP